MSTLLGRWQQQAPDESQPFFLRHVVRLQDRDWAGALADLEEAFRLGHATGAPPALFRAAPLAGARRLREVAALGDSLRSEDPTHTGVRAAALALQGRPAALARALEQFARALDNLGASEDVRRTTRLGATLLPLRMASMVGDPSPAAVRTVAAAVERLTEDVPGAERARLRHTATHAIGFAAAAAGDTALLARWRHAPGLHEDAPELDALARLRSGDRAGATRVLDARRPEAAVTVEQLYARAEVERALGRTAAAWRSLARLDSVEVNEADLAPEEWLLYVRALARRADAAEERGDVEAALRDWCLVRDLWARGEPVVRPIQALAAARATALERARDAGGVPLRTRR